MTTAPAQTRIDTSVAVLRAHAGARRPRVAVLLGSGWAGVADAVADAADIGYSQLPAFPALSIGGHAARVRMGRLGDAEVLVLAGRKHAYEDGDPAAMKGVIRTLAAFGIQVLVQSNAAGSLDPAMPPGSLMLVADHLNIAQRSPLVGEAGDGRFVAMADAYDPQLIAVARAAALAEGVSLDEGVYAWVLGPQFETPAEIRMLARLGARAVGMSTVPETILARHAGLRVLALSMVTNLAAGLGDEPLGHAHTLHTASVHAAKAERMLTAIVQAVASGLDGDGLPG